METLTTPIPAGARFQQREVSYSLVKYYKFIYTHTDKDKNLQPDFQRFRLLQENPFKPGGYYLGGIKNGNGYHYHTSMIVTSKYRSAGANEFVPVAETSSGKFVAHTQCDKHFEIFLQHKGIVMYNYDIYIGASGEWRIRGNLTHNGEYKFPPDFVWDTNILWQNGPIIGTSNGPVFVQWGDPKQLINLVQDYLANSGIVLEEFCGVQILPQLFG